MIKINLDTYNKHRGDFTYKEIVESIEKNWGRKYDISTISRCFTGKNFSYHTHSLVASVLGIDVREVFEICK